MKLTLARYRGGNPGLFLFRPTNRKIQQKFMDKFSWEVQKLIKSFLLPEEHEITYWSQWWDLGHPLESLPLAGNHIVKKRPTSSQVFPGVERHWFVHLAPNFSEGSPQRTGFCLASLEAFKVLAQSDTWRRKEMAAGINRFSPLLREWEDDKPALSFWGR